MVILLFIRNDFIIKACTLLTIMCEVIFSIAFYPLLTFIDKSDESYRKKTLIEYFSKDIAIVSCGFLIGVSFGKYVFNYDTCLIVALISSVLSLIFLIKYKNKGEETKHKAITLIHLNKLYILILIKYTYHIYY